MDPNATLAEARRIVDRFVNGGQEAGDATRLADLWEAMDQWLSHGGFVPDEWRMSWSKPTEART